MTRLPDSNTAFGVAIAYLIPGFLCLAVLAQFSPPIAQWLLQPPPSPATVGGFLYATLASLTLGLILSTLRWFLLDRLHEATGVACPVWDFSTLQQHVDAFQLAIDYHYRYYQFYGNTLMVLVVLPFLRHPFLGLLPGSTAVQRVLLSSLAMLFFLASRDALRKYYVRASAVSSKSAHDTKEPTHDQRIQTPPETSTHAQETANC